MKKNLFMSGVSVTAVIAFFMLLTAGLYPATISFMAGDVKVVRDGKPNKAEFQMALVSGDIIKAGSGSFADISYENGTVIKVLQNSTIRIGTKNVAGSESMSVTSGIVTGKFAKLMKGQNATQKIYTPTTVCSVRGTEFSVAVSEGADSRVQMKEGTLDVYNPQGQIKLSGRQNAEIGLAEKPAPGGKAESLEEWSKESTQEMDKNPEAKSDDFQKYLDILNSRSMSASGEIEKLGSQQSAAESGGEDSIEKASSKAESVGKSVEDDLYLNEAANNTIDGILNRYQKDKKDMYDKFLKIKQESNKVLEQQKKNYEAIQAVREAYRKAKEEILNKNKGYMDQIKGGFDKSKYKPAGKN